MPVISVVGRKKVGKTTLVERLVPVLKARGYRVATIKRDAHRFDIDKPGKDTWRHYEAGADAVLISSSEKLALIKRLDDAVPLNDLVTEYFGDYDIVITEGYKREDKPKIEVNRRKVPGSILCAPGDNLMAIVGDPADGAEAPVFAWNELEKLADRIVSVCSIKKSK